jgi:hypothetical protein
VLTALLAKLAAEQLNEDEASTPGGVERADDRAYRAGWMDRTRTIVEWLEVEAAKQKARDRRRATKWYRDLRKQGRCVKCRKAETGGAAMCPTCAEAERVRLRERYDDLRRAGVCVRCKAERGRDGVECVACAEKSTERVRRRRAA